MDEDTRSARRAEIKVTIDGHDATDYMEPYLLELSYTDNASGKADDLQIVLHDRDGKWSNEWMPRRGQEVSAEITCFNWEEPGKSLKLPCGKFKIDEVEYVGPPQKVTIKALTADLSGPIRDTKKNKGWEKTKFSTVINDVARANNLEVDSDASGDGDCDVERMDQRNESDISFLCRVTEERGMNCKVHDGKLVVRDGRKAEAQKPAMTIPRMENMYSPTRYSFKKARPGPHTPRPR